MLGYLSDSSDVHWLWRRQLAWHCAWVFPAHSRSWLKTVTYFCNNILRLETNFRFIFVGESDQTWVPIVCLLMYVCTSMIGLLTIPWTMTAELFPNEIRGIAHSISYSMANLLMFLAVQVYRFVFHTIVTACMGLS